MSQVADVQLASQLATNNYVNVAFGVVLFYDYFLTFGQEVEFIWKQQMNIGKILFLLNRYIQMTDQVLVLITYLRESAPNDKACFLLFGAYNWMSVVSVSIVDVLVVLRTWALWRKSKVVLIALSFLLVACLLVLSGSALYVSLTDFAIPTFDNVTPCNIDFPDTNVLYALWASLIVFDSVIMVMTLIKVLPGLQHNVPTPLLTMFLKDGIQYFIMIFLVSIGNIIMIAVAPGTLGTVLTTFYPVMKWTLGSRLVLNLRGSILQPISHDEPTTIELNTLVFNGPHSDPTTPHSTTEDLEDPENTTSHEM